MKKPKLKLLFVSLGLVLLVAVLAVSGIYLWQNFLKPSTLIVPKTPTTGYVTSAQISLSWQKIDGAVNYTIECARDEAFSQVISTATTTNTNAICGSLSAGTDHWARLKATIPGGSTDWSIPLKIKTVGTNVSPKNVVATTLSAKEIRVSWDTMQGIQRYDVQWATDQSFTTKVTNVTVSSNTATATFLEPSTTYYIRVRASNSDNPSAIVPYSSFVTATTKQQ